jgi:hypothetical protein
LASGGTSLISPTNNALLRVNASGNALEPISPIAPANSILQYKDSVWSAQSGIMGRVNQIIAAAGTTILRYTATANNVATGMIITITPASTASKILLIADVCAGGYGGHSYAGFTWFRRGTGPLMKFGYPMGFTGGGTTNVAPGTARGMALDTAGVVTAITYEIYADIEYYNTGEFLINWGGTLGATTLVAMEFLP